MILLYRSPQCGNTTLDPILASVSSNTGGWVNYLLVYVRITNFVFETKSSSLVVPGKEPSPTSSSLSLGILGERLVVGFLGGIFLQTTRVSGQPIRVLLNKL
jgi:hypothetical protein